jgi:hypothetical protein
VSHVSVVGQSLYTGQRTEVGVWAGSASSHHWHGLAAAGTHGRGREAGAEGLAALGEVLDGAVDLCGVVSTRLRDSSMVTMGPVTATYCRIGTDNPHYKKQRTLKLRGKGIGDLAVDSGACAYIHVNRCTCTVETHLAGT